MAALSLAESDMIAGHDSVVSRSVYVFSGPLQKDRWYCPACRSQTMLDIIHSRHWNFDYARYCVRSAREPRPGCSFAGGCFGRDWHIGQARKCREYAHNVNGMIEGRPNRYAAKKGK